MVLVSVVMLFHPSGGNAVSDRLWALCGIPIGGWMVMMTVPWARRIAADLGRRAPVIRLDETGILIDIGTKCFFPWSENLAVKFVDEPPNNHLEASNDAGVTAKVRVYDVTVPLREISRQIEVFRKAYGSGA